MSKVRDGVIYGVRLLGGSEYRYVGLTTKSVQIRMRQHFKLANGGRKTPFYDWLRKHERNDVIADALEWVDGLRALGEAEIAWIAYLRREGHSLLNLSEGGLGPTGMVWTTEMREAARIRSTGRPGVHRFGADAPFYGRSHSAAQRAKWSADRKGSFQGEENPNFGKFGPAHPGFGHTVSEETRQLLSEQKTGARNPNYGRKASAETRAKMSAVRKGRPKPSSRRSAHTRYHTNKGVFKESCQHCVADLKNKNGPRPDVGG